MRKKGVFVCIEGLDGCGKTTQARLLVARMRRMGYDILSTAEQSRGEIGKFIERYCLHGEKRGSPVTEALLFAADRFEHVKREIVPALDNGKVVISDRYVYSSLAYQGAAGLDLDWIKAINLHAVEPDLAIFIDVEPEIAMRRLKRKKSVMESLETQRKVREVYLRFVESGELFRIDGNRSEKEVSAGIVKTVLKFLEKSG